MKFTKYQERGAYHYKWYYEDKLDWYVKCVDRVVEFCKGPTLDVGCGEGLLTNKLPKGSIGFDDDPLAIQLSLEHVYDTLRCFLVDLYEVPIEGAWEYLACLNVIEHLERPERIVEIFRDNITKAGIIITDEARATPGKFHIHEFTIDELMDLFKDYNPLPFTIEASENYIGVYISK